MEPKMTDIAKAAGVSIATVGRVIHNKGYVSPEARKRVEEAVEQLGYVPNTLARALITNRSGIIGCVMLENGGNPHQEINKSLMMAAEKHGYRLFTMQSRVEVRDEEELIRQFIGLRVDGVVLLADMYFKEKHLELLHKRSIAVAAIERPYFLPYVDNICFKDEESAYFSTHRMLEKGHRRIAFLGPKPEGNVEEERFAGFCRAMEEGGVPREEQILERTDSYRIDAGAAGMEHLLALSEPPTAVYCSADILAAGAMQTLHKRGLHVPEDMSISAHDNYIAQMLAPPINSAEPCLETVGERTIELLLSRMENPELAPRVEEVGMRYIDRGTVLQK